MSKILKVIKPFFVMEVGDTFELSDNGKEYVSEFNMERHESDSEDSTVSSRYSSNYTISTDYANMLIEEGYLSEVDKNTTFVNVFDEINNMLDTYKEELESLDEDMANMPACMKVEKQTVLHNLITALEHLNSLKK